MVAAGKLIPFNTARDDLHDDGDDPCFRQLPYTWGICRPNVRQSVSKAHADNKVQHLFFVARHKPTGCVSLRGYFRVAETLTPAQAWEKFGGRRNVIIEPLPTCDDKSPLEALRDYVRSHQPPRWDNRFRRLDKQVRSTSFAGLTRADLENLAERDVPLCAFEEDRRLWAHRWADNHALDDWYCSRIFRCQKGERGECLTSLDARCKTRRRRPMSARPYYIVGDRDDCALAEPAVPWECVVRRLGLEYDRLLRKCLVAPGKDFKPLSDIKGQSNVVNLDQREVDELRGLLRGLAVRAA